MKKLVGIFIIGILILSGLLITSMNISSMEINNNLKEIIFLSDPIIESKNDYLIVKLKESKSNIMNNGKPMIPIYSKTYTLPFGTSINNIQCKIKNIDYINLSKKIYPAPESITLNDKEKYHDLSKLNINNSVYNSRDFYPDKWYDYNIGCGLQDSERVVFLNIRFFPIRYSPALDIIEFVNEFEIYFEYDIPISPIIFPNEYEMVVISDEMFLDEIQPLIEYKNEFGIKTKHVTLNDIYDNTYFSVQGLDNAEKVKYFIKNAIEKWGILYVLLVGDTTNFPVRYSWLDDGEEENFISDLYFADIYNSQGDFCNWNSDLNDKYGEQADRRNIDLFPDIYLGRFATSNEMEAGDVVNKSISYMSKNAPSESWFNNMIVCGGDTHEDDYNVDEGEYLTDLVLNDFMMDFQPVKIWASLGNLDEVSDLIKVIHQGAGFLYMVGHGSPYSWTTHPHNEFDTWLPLDGCYNNHISLLQNKDKLPIVVISACSVANFDIKNCFSWSFISNYYGGGIATFSSTGIGWSFTGDNVNNGLNGGLSLAMFESYVNDNSDTAGELWLNALTYYMNNFFDTSNKNYKTVEASEPFCDPSLRIISVESQIPNKPDKPNGPIRCKIGNDYIFNCTSIDPDGDKIKYCFNWGDGNNSWTDWVESGVKTQMNYTWNTRGDYEIRVKVMDENGLLSEWSDSLPITSAKNKSFSVFNPWISRLIERFPILEIIL